MRAEHDPPAPNLYLVQVRPKMLERVSIFVAAGWMKPSTNVARTNRGLKRVSFLATHGTFMLQGPSHYCDDMTKLSFTEAIALNPSACKSIVVAYPSHHNRSRRVKTHALPETPF